MTIEAGHTASQFTPPAMAQTSSDDPIYTEALSGDPWIEDARGMTDYLHFANRDLFVTETAALATTGLTAASLHDAYGPPIPAGVVWHEPVWAVAHIEHVNAQYLRPTLRKLQFEPEQGAVSALDSLHYLAGTDRPLSQQEKLSREHAQQVTANMPPWSGTSNKDREKD